MNAETTMNALKKFCKANSGDEQIWSGNKATYYWNLGKVDRNGVTNGVVRKLAGIDATQGKIWVVAGSFKIAPNGDVIRFTGLNKKLLKQVLDSREVHVQLQETVTV